MRRLDARNTDRAIGAALTAQQFVMPAAALAYPAADDLGRAAR